MANPSRITHLKDIALDELVLEPGQTIDLRTDREMAGLPPAAARVPSEQFERAPERTGVPQEEAQTGRRISPLVSGVPAPRGAAVPFVRRYPPGHPRSVSTPAPVSPVVESPPTVKVATPDLMATLKSPAAPRLIGLVPQVRPPADRPKLTHAQQRGKLVVQLGRFGDIINLLPLLEEESRQLRAPVRLMVAKEYASVLEGVSYITPVIFEGGYGELDKALEQAKKIDPDARCAQVYMPGRVFPRREDSFARDSWGRLGKSFLWEQLPLVFNRRDREREQALAGKIDWEKPVVLVNLKADSYPFPSVPELMGALLVASHKHDFLLVDLADENLRAHRIYDLLGLFDKAACLVTADTATLHLAAASSVPVVAFRVGLPWFASPRRANHILNRRYTDVDLEEVTAEVVKTAEAALATKIVHVWPDREMATDEELRSGFARQSWARADIDVIDLGINEHSLPRNSKDKLGDAVAAPYILDLLAEGLKQLKTDDDILLYTNSDVGFNEQTMHNVRQLCRLKGACFGYRFDHPKDMIAEIGAPDYLTTVSGQCHGGLDLFAFTRRWLMKYGGLLPDMVIGRTNWDLVFRDVIKRTGGGEVYGAIWHQNHESWWKANSNSAGNRHNIKLFEEYRKHNDVTRPYDR